MGFRRLRRLVASTTGFVLVLLGLPTTPALASPTLSTPITTDAMGWSSDSGCGFLWLTCIGDLLDDAGQCLQYFISCVLENFFESWFSRQRRLLP